MQFKELPEVDGLILSDLSKELWREYIQVDPNGNIIHLYKIKNPIGVYRREKGITQRVVDNMGIVHCCPIPGSNGWILRWENINKNKPVNW